MLCIFSKDSDLENAKSECSSSKDMLNVQYVDSKVLMDIIQEFRYIRYCTPVAHNGNQVQLLDWFAQATLHFCLGDSARKDWGPQPVPAS